MALFLREAMRAIASLGCEVAMRAINARHRPKHVATRLPPAGPHTDFMSRNRRRHKNRSNRQRRREDTANDPNS
jgi:hypothetical protein